MPLLIYYFIICMWYLESINLFDIICPHRFKEFKQTHTFKEYKKGEFIYLHHDLSTRLYLIAKGKVKLVQYTNEGDEVLKAILSRGEVFGEMALLGEEKRNEVALAADTVSLCPISIEDLQEMMRKNRDLSLHIYKIIGWRIKKLERRLELLFFKDAKTRLLAFIKDLAHENSTIQNNQTIIKHHYTQQDIANLIATSRPTLNILLNELKEDGIIEFNRGEIIIKKMW